MSRRLTARRSRLVLLVAIAGIVAGIVATSALSLAFNDTPCIESASGGVRVCPTGAVDSPYSVQITARAGCEPHYRFSVINGALPPGLSMDTNGLISGTPTHAGGWTFWLEVADVTFAEGGPDWCLAGAKAEREFAIGINAGLVVTTASVPAGSPGVPYSASLSAAMKNGPEQTAPPSSPVSWSVVEGTLPPGLALGESDGVISGTPSAEGSWGFVVRAALSDARAATKALSIEVKAALALVAPASISRTEVGVPVQIVLGATGGTPPYAWTLATGALPRGVVLAPDGTILGRPREAGVFPFTVAVADSGGQTLSFEGTLDVAPRLAVASLPLRPGMVGRVYRTRIATTGGIAPTSWRIVRGPLPRGLRFDRKLGVLSGAPKRAGRYRIRFQVVDALGVKSAKTFLLKVAPAPKKKKKKKSR